VFLLIDPQRPGGTLPPHDEIVKFPPPHTFTASPVAGAQ
jgi:hypothetical protein